MIRALAASTTWLLGGAALTGALYWAFLHTPESTVFTLALSLVLVIVMYVAQAVMWSGAWIGWSAGFSWQELRRAPRGLSVFLPPLLFVVSVWWALGRILVWMDGHAGEINAWFMATLDWSDVSGLLTSARWLVNWARGIAIPFAALVWLGALLTRGWRPLMDRACLAHACSPRHLLLVTLIAGVIVAPLRYGLYWMPKGLPPTWIEPAFAAAKLGLLAVLTAIGVSFIVRLSASR